MVHDLIIVGGGPAGLTAGVYARTRNLSTLILEAEQAGGQPAWLLPWKSGYGYPSYISRGGRHLGQLFVGPARVGGGAVPEGETRWAGERGPSGYLGRS